MRVLGVALTMPVAIYHFSSQPAFNHYIPLQKELGTTMRVEIRREKGQKCIGLLLQSFSSR